VGLNFSLGLQKRQVVGRRPGSLRPFKVEIVTSRKRGEKYQFQQHYCSC
jgi:hypothetical protein